MCNGEHTASDILTILIDFYATTRPSKVTFENDGTMPGGLPKTRPVSFEACVLSMIVEPAKHLFEGQSLCNLYCCRIVFTNNGETYVRINTRTNLDSSDNKP